MPLSAQFTYIVGCLGPVVTISDVETGNLVKLTLEELRVFVGASPKNVLNTVVALHITPGLVLSNYLDAILDCLLVVTESKEHGANVGVLDIGQLGAIFFLLG